MPTSPMALPTHPIRLADLSNRKQSALTLEPDAQARAAIADVLGINALKKLRFEGELAPFGKRDWRLTGTLGATVVQDCVVTLAPVTTRIDEDVTRHYLSDLPEVTENEAEMPEDDTTEPLPAVIDLYAVVAEALALALPPYPRAPGAGTGDAVFTEPGKAPMRDEDTRPFAGLAGLTGLGGKPGDDDGSDGGKTG